MHGRDKRQNNEHAPDTQEPIAGKWANGKAAPKEKGRAENKEEQTRNMNTADDPKQTKSHMDQENKNQWAK